MHTLLTQIKQQTEFNDVKYTFLYSLENSHRILDLGITKQRLFPVTKLGFIKTEKNNH